MRKLLFLLLLLVLAAIGWGTYWVIGSSATERALNAWFADRRAEGWVAETTSLTTRGFPSRFDTTFEGLNLADPDTQVAWSAPLFQLLSLSYKPQHLIAVWPGTQTLSTPTGTYEIESDALRGSIIVAPSRDYATVSTTIEADAATIAASQGWTATLDHAQVSAREHPDAEMAHTYDLYMTVEALDPGDAFLAPLKGVAGLPRVIDTLTISAEARFDKAWDISAIEVGRPQPREITISQLSATWGDLQLEGQGTLEIDEDGRPTGEIAFEATNWRDMVAIAEASGTISSGQARAILGGLGAMANLTGDPNQLDVTLSYARGIAFLGPVPIGAAPVMKLP